MKIEIGEIIKTSYGTGPYRVVGITRGCRCSHFLDTIECLDNPLPEHVHLAVKGIESGDPGWLNYYDEVTLKSVRKGNEDRIIRVASDALVQQSMF